MSYSTRPLDAKRLLAERRDVMLSHPQYEEIFTDKIETFEIVTSSLSDPDRIAQLPPEKPMIASRRRAWDAVAYLHLQYSAGEAVQRLAEFFPLAMSYWTDYAKYDKAFDASPAAGGRKVPHIELSEPEYWDAIRLACFSVCLRQPNLLPQITQLWDYGSDDRDGLLERLVAPFVPGRAEPPPTCTRHLPYFKLLKVFDAEPDKRPALMAKYMDEWYEASRREPYYNSHTKGRNHNYLGYWSFEAAAVTIVLGIDDSSYRDHEFYPKDLADFARSHGAADTAGASGSPKAQEPLRLRCPGGEPCPREGWWFTPAKLGSRRHFTAGEVMPQFKSDWGDTIWQWDQKQD